MPAHFSCNLTTMVTPLSNCWEHAVRSNYALMTLRGDWWAQPRKTHDELEFRHARVHGILDDVGTLIYERGRLIHSFFDSDRIFYFLPSIGMKPFFELSFMTGTLASEDATVFKYRGNITSLKSCGTSMIMRAIFGASGFCFCSLLSLPGEQLSFNCPTGK